MKKLYYSCDLEFSAVSTSQSQAEKLFKPISKKIFALEKAFDIDLGEGVAIGTQQTDTPHFTKYFFRFSFSKVLPPNEVVGFAGMCRYFASTNGLELFDERFYFGEDYND